VLVEAAVPIPLLLGDLPTTRKNLPALTEQASHTGFRIWEIYAGCFAALLLHHTEEAPVALPRLEAAVRDLQGSGFCTQLCAFICRLAEVQVNMGNFAAALTTLEDPLVRCDRHGDQWLLAELLRMKAEALVAQALPDAEVRAHALLLESLVVARRQGALSWELRSAMSLALLLRRQGRPGEARDILAPIHARFDEGFGSTDLAAAKVLLSVEP
jgi:predicted ATPase